MLPGDALQPQNAEEVAPAQLSQRRQYFDVDNYILDKLLVCLISVFSRPGEDRIQPQHSVEAEGGENRTDFHPNFASTTLTGILNCAKFKGHQTPGCRAVGNLDIKTVDVVEWSVVSPEFFDRHHDLEFFVLAAIPSVETVASPFFEFTLTGWDFVNDIFVHHLPARAYNTNAGLDSAQETPSTDAQPIRS